MSNMNDDARRKAVEIAERGRVIGERLAEEHFKAVKKLSAELSTDFDSAHDTIRRYFHARLEELIAPKPPWS